MTCLKIPNYLLVCKVNDPFIDRLIDDYLCGKIADYENSHTSGKWVKDDEPGGTVFKKNLNLRKIFKIV